MRARSATALSQSAAGRLMDGGHASARRGGGAAARGGGGGGAHLATSGLRRAVLFMGLTAPTRPSPKVVPVSPATGVW